MQKLILGSQNSGYIIETEADTEHHHWDNFI